MNQRNFYVVRQRDPPAMGGIVPKIGRQFCNSAVGFHFFLSGLESRLKKWNL